MPSGATEPHQPRCLRATRWNQYGYLIGDSSSTFTLNGVKCVHPKPFPFKDNPSTNFHMNLSEMTNGERKINTHLDAILSDKEREICKLRKAIEIATGPGKCEDNLDDETRDEFYRLTH